MELYVWGPGYSLPSMDAQCLAAVIYLAATVSTNEWVMVAASPLSLDLPRELPVLHHGAHWITGFRNIVEHLRHVSDGRWDLDSGLNALEKAELIAYTSMLEEHGQPLLDLSMYISGQNYVSVTRPLLSSILPWPLQYVVPPKLKTLARSRTEHLGLSSLDIDADEDDRAASSASKASSQLGSTFLARSKVTATSLLNQPEHTTKIRLSALCASVFEPLQDRLGGKRFLLSSTGPSSVDCIALGHLSLALVPGMPHPWLADELLNNYGALSEYVMGGRSSILDKTSLRHEKMSPASNGNGPWWNSALAIAAISVRMLLEATNGAIPFGSPVRDSTLFRESDMKDGQLGAGDSSRASLPQR